MKLDKPIIETLINSSALAMTPLGVIMLSNRDWFGLVLIAVGVSLEYLKYYGRLKKLW